LQGQFKEMNGLFASLIRHLSILRMCGCYTG